VWKKCGYAETGLLLLLLLLQGGRVCLFHDLLLRSYLYHCVWSVITAHNVTPEKHDNNYSPHPLSPTSCLHDANFNVYSGISDAETLENSSNQ